ncbi:MAG TPA: hypothetical protein VM938_02080 [Acidimicrobiales bacterium]|nr:hypothetical protein [Acidimicrobiales bacterium]
MKRLAVAVVVLAVGVGVGGELVSADAPVKQGWWSKWQAEPATSSALPPTIPITPTVPGPPTGDEGGLTVAHGLDGPQAIAAMHFTVEASVDATLYLEAAPKQKAGTGPSTSTTVDQAPHPDAIVLPPGATVFACPALSAWDGEVNGPWSKVPTWDNVNCAPGTVAAGGTAMFWTLSSSMQDVDDNYDIVLVPTGPPPPPPGGAPSAPTQTSYMVNFASPGAGTLVTEDLPDDDEPTTTTTLPDDDTPPLISVPELFEPPTAGLAAPPTRVGSTPTSLVALRRPPSTVARTPFRFPDTRAERMMAVSMLLAMAGALWWLGGSPTRGPRLIGAVAGRTPGQSPAVPAPLLRGVGRFARPRGGRAPRL